MPICSFKGCTYGSDGKSFGGSSQEVFDHEVDKHNKRKTPVNAVKAVQKPLPVATVYLMHIAQNDAQRQSRTTFPKNPDVTAHNHEKRLKQGIGN